MTRATDALTLAMRPLQRPRIRQWVGLWLLLGLLFPTLPALASSNTNGTCPAGTSALAKFNQKSGRYYFDGPRGNNRKVRIVGNARTIFWASGQEIEAIVVQGRGEVHKIEMRGAKKGSFTNSVFSSRTARRSAFKTVKFCVDSPSSNSYTSGGGGDSDDDDDDGGSSGDDDDDDGKSDDDDDDGHGDSDDDDDDGGDSDDDDDDGKSDDDDDDGGKSDDGVCPSTCEGKVSSLTLRYDGHSSALIEADIVKPSSKSVDNVFQGILSPGDTFTIVGPANRGSNGFNGTLGNELALFINGHKNAQIHTSCSQPVDPGLRFGKFTIVAASSKNGGPVTSSNDAEPPQISYSFSNGPDGEEGTDDDEIVITVSDDVGVQSFDYDLVDPSGGTPNLFEITNTFSPGVSSASVRLGFTNFTDNTIILAEAADACGRVACPTCVDDNGGGHGDDDDDDGGHGDDDDDDGKSDDDDDDGHSDDDDDDDGHGDDDDDDDGHGDDDDDDGHSDDDDDDSAAHKGSTWGGGDSDDDDDDGGDSDDDDDGHGDDDDDDGGDSDDDDDDGHGDDDDDDGGSDDDDDDGGENGGICKVADDQAPVVNDPTRNGLTLNFLVTDDVGLQKVEPFRLSDNFSPISPLLSPGQTTYTAEFAVTPPGGALGLLATDACNAFVFDPSLDCQLVDGNLYCQESASKSGVKAEGIHIEVAESTLVPEGFVLEENYPNPFNPSTEIRFSLAETAEIELAVFDVTGRRVALLAHGRYDVGYHAVTFDARLLPSGVYFYRLDTGKEVQVRPMTLLK